MRKTPNDSHNETTHTPVRKCILSGERSEKAALIRLALGPDGEVAPDVLAKAPGRGAWIGVSQDELEKAQSKGKLEGALGHAFKTRQLNVAEDLSKRIKAGLEKAVLDRLGLEARASNLICGAEKIDTAARMGGVALLLHAADASEDGSKKRDQSWRVGMDAEGSGQRGIRLPFNRDALSAALGRENAVHIALTDEKAADRVMHHLGRWLKFNGYDIEEDKQGRGVLKSAEPKPAEDERSGL